MWAAVDVDNVAALANLPPRRRAGRDSLRGAVLGLHQTMTDAVTSAVGVPGDHPPDASLATMRFSSVILISF